MGAQGEEGEGGGRGWDGRKWKWVEVERGKKVVPSGEGRGRRRIGRGSVRKMVYVEGRREGGR